MSESGPRPAHRAVAAVSVVAGAGYVLGAAPGIQVWDTAELAGAAFRFGVSHPPGQPLYTMMGKFATLLPLGSIAFRANLLSAVAAALATWLVGRLALTWAERVGVSGLAAGPLAVAAFAANGPLVNQATRAEVYAPAVALFLSSGREVVRAVLPERCDVRALAGAGLWAGLAATMHPVAGLCAALAGLVAVVVLRPRPLRRPRVWILAASALVVGALPLALIVARCRGDLEPCWEVKMTGAAFLRYVTGATFRQNVQTGGAAFAAAPEALRFVLARSGLLAPLVLLIGAGVALRRGRARSALSLLAAIGVSFGLVLIAPFHADNPDLQGYMLPALALTFAAAPVCALWALGPLGKTPPVVLAVATAVAAVALGDGAASLRPRAYLAGDVGARALAEPAPKALAVVGSDAIFFAMQYGQLVEGQRPDLGLMATGLSSSSRQWVDVARHRPEVVLARARPRGPGETSLRYARGALDLVAGVLPRWVEDPLLDVHRIRSTGVLFRMDASGEPVPLPRSIARELVRRRRSYADGTDAMMRLVYLRRAFDREAHDEIGPAAGELRAGLWDEGPQIDRLLAGFRPAPVLRVRPLTPLGYQGWIADAGTLRAVLARVLYRGGRSDLAVRVLEREFDAGNAQAALVLAEIELREGRTDEAEALYRAFAAANPDRKGYAQVGLALVRASRGDRAGADRALARVEPGADPVLRLWARDIAKQIIPALAP